MEEGGAVFGRRRHDKDAPVPLPSLPDRSPRLREALEELDGSGGPRRRRREPPARTRSAEEATGTGSRAD
jgi:hypothetical protein